MPGSVLSPFLSIDKLMMRCRHSGFSTFAIRGLGVSHVREKVTVHIQLALRESGEESFGRLGQSALDSIKESAHGCEAKRGDRQCTRVVELLPSIQVALCKRCW